MLSTTVIVAIAFLSYLWSLVFTILYASELQNVKCNIFNTKISNVLPRKESEKKVAKTSFFNIDNVDL